MGAMCAHNVPMSKNTRPEQGKKRTNLFLSNELHARLKEKASNEGRKLGWLVDKAIENFLKSEEQANQQ